MQEYVKEIQELEIKRETLHEKASELENKLEPIAKRIFSTAKFISYNQNARFLSTDDINRINIFIHYTNQYQELLNEYDEICKDLAMIEDDLDNLYREQAYKYDTEN